MISRCGVPVPRGGSMLFVCMNWKLHCKSLMMLLCSGVILMSAMLFLS